MTGEMNTPAASCCDCGRMVDSTFAKNPDCGRKRCRACDEIIGAQPIAFTAEVKTFPPREIEFCTSCYNATR